MLTRNRILTILIAILLICGGVVILFYLTFFRNQVNPLGFLGSGESINVDVPAGFEVTIFADDLKGPRFINFDDKGVLHVADRGNGRIVAYPDQNQDGKADETIVVAKGLDSPHSLVFREGSWYIGVPAGVVRLDDTDDDGIYEAQTTLINTFTPPGQHSTRTVEFLPDGRMVISAGSTCNVCDEEDPRRAAITIYDDPVGDDAATGERLFATGLRNAVGLAIHPETGELWVSNNGRDLIGDDIPPETIYIVEDGLDYGWPTCHSGNLVDPDMGNPDSCDGVEPPVVEMQAHMAPLGIAFYTGDTFPEEYHGDLFIAQHGSWNRTVPVGYKVSRLPLDGNTPGELEDFAAGWLDLDDNVAYGRPVGLAVGPDGALYISDDKAHLIYRIAYNGE